MPNTASKQLCLHDAASMLPLADHDELHTAQMKRKRGKSKEKNVGEGGRRGEIAVGTALMQFQ